VITDSEIALRLVISALLGMVVGYERERRDQPAGLRTHMVLAIGAALAMTVSINLSLQYHSNADPARLAAQVVSGVGFLGAGAILRHGISIKGLTTAASLWTVAMVGLAVGAGYYLGGVSATLLVLLALTVLNIVEKRMLPTYNAVHVRVEASDRAEVMDEVETVLRRREKRSVTFGLERDLVNGLVVVEAEVHLWRNDTSDNLVKELGSIQGVRHVRVSG
jgi:putative Mg2+ transporter-C (MgtC) family protein